jgi:hypothetical protein
MKTSIAGGAALLLGASATIAGLAALELPAHAATKAKVTVTITQDNAEMSGTVSSRKPAKCADARTVWVWEQIGTRGGGDDIKSFQDTTSLQGTKYVWNTGTTGVEGFFYAKVQAKPGCKPAVSKTIEVKRDENQ